MIFTQKSEVVDALPLKGTAQFTPLGGTTQFGKPGDFMIHWADGSMSVMARSEFESRFGRTQDCTAKDTAERQRKR